MKTYAGLGQAGAVFGMYLPDYAQQHPELRVLTADMSYIAKLERFKALYPDQFINVGIAEQNMLGVCAGLTSEGFRCVALAQATFITMRSFEQVRQYMSYMRYPIVLVGLAAGFQLQFMGNTHYALEDIALMRSIPGIVIMSPADAGSAIKCFEAALEMDRPVYIRFSGDASTCVYPEDFDYAAGKAVCLKEGGDVCIFATGSMMEPSLKAAEIIEGMMDVSVRVTDVHTIEPLDGEAVAQARGCRLVVSAEEHHIKGGLGSAISDFSSAFGDFPPLLRIGVGDEYPPVGDYGYLLRQTRLTPEMMAEDICRRLSNL